MAKIKLTKTAVESAQPQAKDIELRDTVVPGFLCKITPTGRRVFMLQYRTNSGQPRKPSLGLYGELTVEQARVKAQDWLAEVRRGGDPGGAKAEARKPCHELFDTQTHGHRHAQDRETRAEHVGAHRVERDEQALLQRSQKRGALRRGLFTHSEARRQG